MKRAFSLVELIFTIVIMAGIFAVIPKIVFATNKSDSFAIKQEAFFNAISLTNIASLLAWDENNTDSMSILQTLENKIECNTTTHLRKGGFLGQYTRNCEDNLSASVLFKDEGESDYLEFDDIDDFNGTEINVSKVSMKTKYKIYTQVDYLDDDIFSDITAQVMTIKLGSTTSATTNIKKFKATIGYFKGVRGRGKDKNITSFYYYSTNIGQISLNSQDW